MGSWRFFFLVFCSVFALGFATIAHHEWAIAKKAHPAPLMRLHALATAATVGSTPDAAHHTTSVPKNTVPETVPEDDAVVLSEEELDRLELERKELMQRRMALEQLLKESRRLVALKEKRIEALQQLLRQP